MTQETDDTLQRRIALFVDEVKANRATNGTTEFCLGTAVGSVRDQNQDRAIIVQAEFSNAPERNFLLGVVADGMGGLISGDKAATIAVSVFVSRVLRASKLPIVERLRQAAFAANEAVFRAFRGRGGTTLSAMFVSSEERAIGLNVGDSRIYGINRYRELKQLSRDDTLGRMLGTRQVDPSQKDRLVQFVGIGEGMEPHIVSAEKLAFSSVLISTDGIHSSVPGAIVQLVKSPSTNIDLVRRLVSLSELIGNDNGTALTLPTQLSDAKESTAKGIDLRFWSAFDRMEIWIPSKSTEIQQQDLLRVELRDEPREGLAYTSPQNNLDERPSERLVRKQKKKSTTEKRSVGRHKKKGKSRDEGEAWLPIEDVDTPRLRISFPEKRRR